MTEISNIDAIIELILREARERTGSVAVNRIYSVTTEVNQRIKEIMNNLEDEERRKEEDENKR